MDESCLLLHITLLRLVLLVWQLLLLLSLIFGLFHMIGILLGTRLARTLGLRLWLLPFNRLVHIVHLLFRGSKLSGASWRHRSISILGINSSLFKTSNSACLMVKPLVDALGILTRRRQGHNGPGEKWHNFKNGPDHGNSNVVHASCLQIENLNEAEHGRRQAVYQ